MYAIQALLAAAIFTIAQSASALVITATLDSFEATPHTVVGVGTGGGRGNFTLVATDSPVPTTLSGILDQSFAAFCLEPNELVTVGQTYNFLVTDLADGPTSTGPMGVAREILVEVILGRLGVTTVEAMSLAGVSAATALTYEAGYEAAANPLDPVGGTAVVTGAGVPDVTLALAGGPQITDVDAYAMLNIGLVGAPATRSLFTGQDFVVTTFNAVPIPGTLALLGLGLLGLTRVRKA